MASFVSLAGVFARGRYRRFAIFASFCANFILVVGVGCIIQALPTSDKPRNRNSGDTKSYYGEGYFALLGLTTISTIQLAIHTICIYSYSKNVANSPEKPPRDEKSIQNPYDDTVKLSQRQSSSATEPETPVPTPAPEPKHVADEKQTYLYMSI